MGRKAKFTEGNKVKKGPGRKAKKQGEPVIPKHLTGKTLIIIVLTVIYFFSHITNFSFFEQSFI